MDHDELAGCGLHHAEAMTDSMREVRDQAVALLEGRLTDEQQAYLTSATLKHYVDPLRPQALAASLNRRHQQRNVLTVQVPIDLVGSLRFVGWDGEGSCILSWETSTQQKSFSRYLPQFEYVVNTALDLNAPSATGFIILSHYPCGYFNPMLWLDPRPLLDLAAMLESQFRRRLKAAIMIGMPRSFERLFSVLAKATKAETRQKLRMAATEADAIRLLRESYVVDEPTLHRIEGFLANRVSHRQSRAVQQEWAPVLDHPFFAADTDALRLNSATPAITAQIHRALRSAVHRWHLQQGHGGTWLGTSPPMTQEACRPATVAVSRSGRSSGRSSFTAFFQSATRSPNRSPYRSPTRTLARTLTRPLTRTPTHSPTPPKLTAPRWPVPQIQSNQLEEISSAAVVAEISSAPVIADICSETVKARSATLTRQFLSKRIGVTMRKVCAPLGYSGMPRAHPASRAHQRAPFDPTSTLLPLSLLLPPLHAPLPHHPPRRSKGGSATAANASASPGSAATSPSPSFKRQPPSRCPTVSRLRMTTRRPTRQPMPS